MPSSFDSTTVPDSTDWLPTPLAALAPLESALRCQVCKDFFNTPMMTSCSHTFCSLCIRRYLSQEGRCPACRTADQELKLRRNWVVEELVSGFVEGRESLLTFARRAAEVEKQKQEGDDNPRPKKRRKVHVQSLLQDGAGAERRSTRSQSRRDAIQASQESTAEHIVADSDDAGSEYEEQEETEMARQAPTPPRAKAELNDGLVACPGCGKRMKEEIVFTHLDQCASIGDGQETTPNTNGVYKAQAPQPGSSIAYTPPDAVLTSRARDRLPTIAYSMLSDTALRKKLQALGISSQGPKLLLQKRHTEWVNLWNADCDSRNPRKKQELLAELDVWERTQGRQILQGMNAAAGGGQGTGVMAKDFDGESWMKGNKSDFEDLVRRAREKKVTVARPDDNQNKAEVESKPKTSIQEIFRSASALPDASGASLETTSDREAGIQSSTSRSPYFEAGVDNASEPGRQSDLQTEQSKEVSSPMDAVVDLNSSTKPAIELEQSQSQGSHVNGVFA